MDYLSQHLTSLRQEITDLRESNLRYSQQLDHSPVEETALEVRENRLLQIKQELSDMKNCPPARTVWWERIRKPNRGV
jgi:hypothetical protein